MNVSTARAARCRLMRVPSDGSAPLPPRRHVIVILGCAVRAGGEPSPAMRRRVALALRVAAGLSHVTFMPIGGLGSHGPAEALVMERLLLAAGIDPAAIWPVPEGATTIHSLLACWPHLRERTAPGDAVVYVCTDAYHVSRCRIILRIWGVASRDAGKAPHAPADAAPSPRVATPKLIWMWLRDRVALLEDVPLALLWRARPPGPAR
jgi:DUF218 domain